MAPRPVMLTRLADDVGICLELESIMPKRQTTAQKRARETSRQGTKYTKALREQPTGSAGPVVSPYADPTIASLRVLALELDTRLRAFVARHGRSDHLAEVAGRIVEHAREYLGRVIDDLDGPEDAQILVVQRTRIRNIVASLRDAQRHVDGAASIQLATEKHAAERIERAARAILRHRCTEGAQSDELCTDSPGRIVVEVKDEFGIAGASEQACAFHAAEYVLQREPEEARFLLRGSRRAAAMTRNIVQELHAEDPGQYLFA